MTKFLGNFLLCFRILACCAAVVLTGCASTSGTSVRSKTPNLVVMYVDDMGWGDAPGFALAGIEPPQYTRDMPNLSRLAREGATFRHYYSAQPVCSASRAALLTGCYPNRIGIHGALFSDARIGIASEERTLAELLRDAGYSTSMAGKWHLGSQPEFNPTRHGFQQFLGIPYSNDMWPPRFPKKHPELPLLEGETVRSYIRTMEDQAGLTALFTQFTVDFIRAASRSDRPFFAYLAHPQPHTPIAASARFTPKDRASLYGAVLREIDWSVGEVLRVLDETNVANNTIVLFTSDNGPWLCFGSDAGSSGGLREGKGTTFEGGVREPCFLRWPDVVPRGAVSDVPWMSIDLLPTIANIVHAPQPAEDRPIDGRDALRVWSCAPDASPTHDAFWFYYHTNHLECVRMGRWKVSLPRTSRTLAGKPGGTDGREVPYVQETVPLALFDLERDPAETTDVAALYPEVLAEILVHVERAREELGDALTAREGRGRREPGRVP
jgi:arylsulfatase A